VITTLGLGSKTPAQLQLCGDVAFLQHYWPEVSNSTAIDINLAIRHSSFNSLNVEIFYFSFSSPQCLEGVVSLYTFSTYALEHTFSSLSHRDLLSHHEKSHFLFQHNSNVVGHQPVLTPALTFGLFQTS
jgi:hypothetical protein